MERDGRERLNQQLIQQFYCARLDKSCRIEVRPANDRPTAASATAATAEAAVRAALGKMKRSLTTFFGRKGRPAVEVTAPASKTGKSMTKNAVKKVAAKRSPAKKSTAKKSATKKSAIKKPTKLSPRGPKKKGIYQARRKPSSGR